MSLLRRIPPSPEVMAFLYEEYVREARDQGMTFAQFLTQMGCSDRAQHHHGMDDGARLAAPSGLERIDIPAHPVVGPLRVKVLLIDFADRVGVLPASHYENLLFSKNTHPTGSMRDYYTEVSLNQVDVTGSVDGWLRMPQPYSFYTNGQSGLGPSNGRSAYPRDARRMAEDAVRVALDNGVLFEPELDLFNEGIVTALFVVHAGEGAEVQRDLTQRLNNIWSHKWQMVNPVRINNRLTATLYLTVPNDCNLGVCAHELGHLAFQWEDFYDPNGSDDGAEWDGSGNWDLMASGSYNGNSRSPAHPVALHKSQHGWMEVEEIRTSASISLPPFTAASAKAAKITSPAYRAGQYLILENRAQFGFDSQLPGEGLLVWRVDEAQDMFAPSRPALLLIQADGRHDLERIETRANYNAGDAGDPFPGSAGRRELLDTGDISTSFPDGHSAGVALKNIRQDPNTKVIDLDVVFAGEPPIGPTEIIRERIEPRLAIPDNDARGVTSVITLQGEGVVRDVAVEVSIAHTYIGDLKVELTAPSGQRAVLHNRTGRGTQNLRVVFRAQDTPALAALADGPVAGDWQLQVTDLAARDTGVLEAWGLAIAVEAQPGDIQVERAPNLNIPDNDPNGVADTINIPRAGVVRSVAVTVDITHTYRRDLRVELVNPQGEPAVLHNRTGGDADNLQATYRSREHADLAGLVGQSTRGDWILRVADLAGGDRGVLNRWRLEIGSAPAVRFFEQTATPQLQIPDNDSAGVGTAFTVAETGTVQSVEIELAITHSYIGDLKVTLVAPSGAQAILHNRAGGRGRNLSLALDSATDSALASLIGQPINGSWLLRIADLAPRDVGTLENWRLRLGHVA